MVRPPLSLQVVIAEDGTGEMTVIHHSRQRERVRRQSLQFKYIHRLNRRGGGGGIREGAKWFMELKKIHFLKWLKGWGGRILRVEKDVRRTENDPTKMVNKDPEKKVFFYFFLFPVLLYGGKDVRRQLLTFPRMDDDGELSYHQKGECVCTFINSRDHTQAVCNLGN